MRPRGDARHVRPKRRCRALVAFVPLIAALGFALSPRPGDAMLCKRRSGAVVLRVACRPERHEAELDLAGLGIAGPPGDPGIAGVSAVRFRLVDANGRRFDGVVDTSSHVVHFVAGHALLLDAGRDGFHERASFDHEGVECQGARLIASGGAKLAESAPILARTAYYAGAPVAAHSIGSRSFTATASDCATRGGTYEAASGLCCVATMPKVVDAGPATPVDLSEFTPPFHLEEER